MMCGAISRLAPTALLCTLFCGGALAQDNDAPIPTLHVYENLVQVPTLVLSRSRKPMPPIAEDRFYVRGCKAPDQGTSWIEGRSFE